MERNGKNSSNVRKFFVENSSSFSSASKALGVLGFMVSKIRERSWNSNQNFVLWKFDKWYFHEFFSNLNLKFSRFIERNGRVPWLVRREFPNFCSWSRKSTCMPDREPRSFLSKEGAAQIRHFQTKNEIYHQLLHSTRSCISYFFAFWAFSLEFLRRRKFRDWSFGKLSERRRERAFRRRYKKIWKVWQYSIQTFDEFNRRKSRAKKTKKHQPASHLLQKQSNDLLNCFQTVLN